MNNTPVPTSYDRVAEDEPRCAKHRQQETRRPLSVYAHTYITLHGFVTAANQTLEWRRNRKERHNVNKKKR
ncbi:hypothetical protein SUGI_0519440 [Cryptomeria japonica]|nr:hypothetical protein SUGI_0519440 [Cryptomeria japonica]